jgi:hypothetical protein
MRGDHTILVGFGTREQKLEACFIVGFSVLIFVLFFSLLGSNGLVLGNDSAVHLETAKYFLQTHHLAPSDILVLPPLFHLILATFLTFTGATTLDQQLLILKLFTATMDWLVVFSVYLLGAKFFSKRTGVLAASLLLLCFPLYELNAWGGYTSILSLAFMGLLFVYLALPLKSAANLLVAFMFAFSVVLAHELTVFVLAFILPPYILIVFLKTKGGYSKALVVVALIGGALAFSIYYLQPVLPYLGQLVSIFFFQIKSMAYQMPSVTADAYLTYFGFLVFFAFAGVAVAFFELRKRKTLTFYLLLVLAFLVPVILSQSYVFGFYLPFQRFIYYLLIALPVLAGVTLCLLLDSAVKAYQNNRAGWKRMFLKAASIAMVAIFVTVAILQLKTVNDKLGEATVFYNSSDPAAYQVSMWLKDHNPEPTANVTVSQYPGHWFWTYTEMNVTTETNPVIEWNAKAESVLDFDYELVHPLTMERFYEAKTGVSDENWVQTNNVWQRITFFPLDNAMVTFRDQNDSLQTVQLSSLSRDISMDIVDKPNWIAATYVAPQFTLVENVTMQNNTYPLTVTWHITATNGDLPYASLYLSEYMDQQLKFTQAYIPGILNWQSPFSNPSKQSPGQWALTNFFADNLTANNCVDVYDPTSQAAFGVKFLDLPHDGNVGALANGNMDAIRWQYNFYKISANYTITVSYQTLAFSMTSQSGLKNPRDMNTLFTLRTPQPFDVQARNFATIIQQERIVYIIFDVNRLDKKILASGWVEQIYANNEYVILRVKANHPYRFILKNATST